MVLSLGCRQIILGMPWLKKWNPTINWKKNTMTLPKNPLATESFKVGHRLVEIIKSLASSGATRWTKGKGWLGLRASDLRQKRCDACIAQIKSME